MFDPRPSVLVVERDEATLTLLCRLLAHAGYDSIAARTGAEALTALCRYTPAAAMVDWLAPGIGGHDLVSMLQQHWPELPLIVTATPPTPWAELAPLQVAARLQRPFDLDALHHALQLAIRSGI